MTYRNTSENPNTAPRTISWVVNDGESDFTIATNTITIARANDAPTAANNTRTINEDATLGFSANDFGFTDVDGDSLSRIIITSLPTMGSLKLNGSAVAQGQSIGVESLGLLSFTPALNASGAPYASFGFRVSDGLLESASTYTMTINVTAVNDAPIISAGSVSNYSENSAAVVIDSALAISDVDHTTLQGATIRISTNYQSGEDILAFNAIGTISGNFDKTTGILTLSGTDTRENYQTVLRSVSYRNSSEHPNTDPRTISWKVNDGKDDSNIATSTITVTRVNDAPTAVNNTLTIDEDATLTFSTSDFGFSDIDGGARSDVIITTLPVGTLRLNGAQVSANQSIAVANLGQLTFTPAANANGTPYTSFTFKVSDGETTSVLSYSMTINVTAVDDLPVISAGSVLSYRENAAPTAVDTAISVNADSSVIQSATISISGNYQSGEDKLGFVNTTSIKGEFDATAGVLKLKGAASLEAYHMALRSVTYQNSSDNPNISLRTISWKVNDGKSDSNIATSTISITAVSDAPVMTAGATLNYTENEAPRIIDNTITLSDIDNTHLTYAVIRISSDYVQGADLLAFSATASISSNFDAATGTLTLQGSDTLENYRVALRSVTYQHTSENPNSLVRTITWVVGDGEATSAEVTSYINISAVNDAPQISTAGAYTAEYVENASAIFVNPSLIIGDADSTTLSEASVKIINYVGGEDSLSFTGIGNITGEFNPTTGVLSLRGTDSLANYQVVLRSVSYRNASDNPNTDPRTIRWTVKDGELDSSAYISTINITAVNDAPMAAHKTVVMDEDTSYTFLSSDFNFADIDGDSLVSIKITTPEIAGSLKLNGVDVLLNQVITRTDIEAGKLLFTPGLHGNGIAYDNFGFKVSDGVAESVNSYTMKINVTAVQDAPTAANNTVTINEDVDYVFTVTDFNFADVDGDTLQNVRITAEISAGSLTLDGVAVSINQVITRSDIIAEKLRFTPFANENGNAYASFGFKVHDGREYSLNAYTMTINVGPVNDAPSSANNSITIDEDSIHTFSSDEFNFADLDGDSLASIKITTLEATGSLKLNGVDVTLNQVITKAEIDSGLLKFTPVANANGNSYDSFGFSVNDGSELNSSAYTMTIHVRAINDASIISASGILNYGENDAPKVIDGGITLSDVDNAMLEGASISIISTNYNKGEDVLSFVNTLNIKGEFNATTGVLNLSGKDTVAAYEAALRSVKYHNTSENPAIAPRTVSWKVYDGVDYSNLATSAINITTVNDAPTAANNTITIDEDTVHVFSISEFNFTDYESETFASIKITSPVSVGSLKLDGVEVSLNQVITRADILANKLSFMPQADTNGSPYDSFDFTVNDGELNSIAYTMTLNVLPMNDAPTAADNIITSGEDTTHTFDLDDFNFSDIDGDSFASFRIISTVSAGSLKLRDTEVSLGQVIIREDIIAGNLTFTPIANENATPYASFTFKVSDGREESSLSYVITMNVSPANDAPTAANSTITIDEDSVHTFSVAEFKFSDIDGDALATVEITAVPLAGSLQLSGVEVAIGQKIAKVDVEAGLLKFIPAANANGINYANFGFKVWDASVASENAYTMTIHVTALNDAPVISVGSGVSYTENDLPKVMDSTITLSDIDDSELESALISISSNYRKSEDVLSFVDTENIKGVFNVTTGILSLSGKDSVAAYQNALRSVKYHNTSDHPSTLARTISWKVYDGDAYSNTVTSEIIVTTVNDAPTAANNSVTIKEDTSYTFNASDFNFADIEGDAFASIKITVASNAGLLQWNNEAVAVGQLISQADIVAGKLKFTPVANANGNAYASFSFKVNDGEADSSAAYSMTVHVDPVNDTPIATNSSITINEDNTHTFSLDDFNFADVDGDTLQNVKITTGISAGSLSLDGIAVSVNQVITRSDIVTGKLRFTPLANENGNAYASFSFKVNDGKEYSLNAYTMTIHVDPVNDAPTSVSNSITIDEDSVHTFSSSEFNFADVDGDSFSSIKITILETVGSLKLGDAHVALNQVITKAEIDSGLLKFTPIANTNGNSYDSFSFSVNDGGDLNSNDYTMTIHVSAVNDAPVMIAGGTINYTENNAPMVVDAGITLNDVDNSTLGSASIRISGNYQSAEDRLAFGAVEGITGTFNVTTGVLSLSGTATREVYESLLRSVSYENISDKPNTSPRTISWSVNDGSADSTEVTSTITITAVNDAPTAANKTVTTNEDTDYTFVATDFNFTDIDGDSLASIKITTLESVGSLKLNGVDVTLNQVITVADIAASKLKFIPVASANGASYDSFGFKVNDGTVDSSSAYTMTINVTAVNDAPTAANKTVTTNEDTDYTFMASDFNFADIDGDTLASVKITTLQTVGSLKLNGVDVSLDQVISRANIDSGLLKFTPVVNANGASYDSFGFKVNDGAVDSTAAYTMTINVTAVNDAPTAANKTVTTNEDTDYTFVASDFNFADIDGDTLASVKITSLETVGSLKLNGVDVTLNQVISRANIDSGLLKFMPVANANGSSYDSFGFKVNDGAVDSTAAYTMTINVTAVNDAPTAANKTVTTNEDTDYTFVATDFNFTDIDGDTLASVKITSLETVGSLKLDNVDVTLNQVISKANIDAGLLKFTPVANANGASYDSFSFKVNDGTVDSTAAYTMTINVTAVNDAPTGVNSTVTAVEDTPYTFKVSDFNFSDIDGDELSEIEITALPSSGSLQFNGGNVEIGQRVTKTEIENGSLKFTPAANANGNNYASFGFKVIDVSLASANAYTMTINVDAVNDAPVLSAGFSLSYTENNAPTVIDNTITLTDVDDSELESATISISGNYRKGEDVLSFAGLGEIIGEFDIASGALKLSGKDTRASYETALRSVKYHNTSDNPTTLMRTISWKVYDGNAYSNIATSAITISAVNDAPTAINSSITLKEDTSYTFSVSDFNFADIEGNAFAGVRITTNTNAGLLQLNNEAVAIGQLIPEADIIAGKLTFTPVANANANGSAYASFSFKVNDGEADSSAAYTMSINVDPVGDAPIATNNTITIDEDNTHIFNLNEFNFADVDGDTLQNVQVTTEISAGKLSLDGVAVSAGQVITRSDIIAGKLRFTPLANENGNAYASFSFKVNDGKEYSLNAYMMTINVNPVNDAPTAANHTITMDEDSTHTFSASEFNFADVDGNSLASVKITTLESVGSLKLGDANVGLNQVITRADIDLGKLTFTPVVNVNGNNYDNFGFSVNDGSELNSTAYTMTIHVRAVNDAPMISAGGILNYSENDASTVIDGGITLSDVDNTMLESVSISISTNYSKGEDVLSFENTSNIKGVFNATTGVLSLSGKDTVAAYEAALRSVKYHNISENPAIAPRTISWKVNDGMSLGIAESTIAIARNNDLPIAANSAVVTAENTNYPFKLADFNFADIDGDALSSIRITSLESVGMLKLNGVDVELNQIVVQADIASLVFVPNPSENGSPYDSFGFMVNDGQADSASRYTMTIHVGSINDAPTAANSTVGVTEDVIYRFSANNFNFSDLDGDSLAGIQITGLNGVGSLKLDGLEVSINQFIARDKIDAGKLTFLSIANENGNNYASFAFKVHDGFVYSLESYTMTIDVASANDAPTAANNIITMDEDGIHTFSVNEFNFADIDGDALTKVEMTTLPGVGSLQLSGVEVAIGQKIAKVDVEAGLLKFIPAANANGTNYANFGFKVWDASVASENAYTMTIHVTALNDAPAISAGSGLIYTENDLPTVIDSTITLSDVDDNELESASISISNNYRKGEDVLGFVNTENIKGVFNVTTGILNLSGKDSVAAYQNALRSVAYHNTSDNPTSLARTISWKVYDGDAYSNIATSAITITTVNDAPTASNNSVTIKEDTSYTFSVSDFNFADIEGDTFASIRITSSETVGSLKLNGAEVNLNQVISKGDIELGKLSFSPALHGNGLSYDTFKFTVSDGVADSSAYTMTVNVLAVADAPLTLNKTVSLEEDTTYVFVAADFNFSDVDGDLLSSIKITALESVGNLQINGVDVSVNQVISKSDIDLGKLTFTPLANGNGVAYDSFSFKVNDGTLESVESYTMSMNVISVNDLPVLIGGRSLVYTENDAAMVIDNTLVIYDMDHLNLVSATVSMSSNYVAGEDVLSFSSTENISALFNPETGVLSLSGRDTVVAYESALRSVMYRNTSEHPSTLLRTISFVVNDGQSNSFAVTSTLSVVTVNDAPVASDATVTINEDTVYTFATSDFNFADVDGNLLSSIKIISLPTLGSFKWDGRDVSFNQVMNASDIGLGKLQFTPVTHANGHAYDSFSFKVNDGAVDSSTAYAMTIHVAAINDAPMATNNIVTTSEDMDYIFTANDFNFTDIDDDALSSVRITVLESVGSLKLNGVEVIVNQVISRANIDSGLLRFTPVANAHGNAYDRFSFKVNDGASESLNAYTMTINVAAVDDAPTAANQTVTINEDTTYTFSPSDFNFTDVDGKSLSSVKVTRLEVVGLLKLDGVDVVLNQIMSAQDIGLGKLKFIPVSNDNGNAYASFDFEVNNGVLESANAYTMTISVTSVNDVPTAANKAVTTNEDTDYTFVSSDFNFADIDGDTLASVKITSLETVGSLKLNGVDVTLNQVISRANIDSGLLKFTPFANANGASYDGFSFKVNDGVVDSVSSYTMTINVAAVNDAPQGEISLSGDRKEGQILVAIDTIKDVDGLGRFSYQWYRNATPIAGAAESIYQLTAADVGKRVYVTIRYMDGYGSVEFVQSNSLFILNAKGFAPFDVDDDGTIDVYVQEGTTVVKNADGTITTTTTSGSTVTTTRNSGATIAENGTTITVDVDGDGVVDVSAKTGSTIIGNTVTIDAGAVVDLNVILAKSTKDQTVVEKDAHEVLKNSFIDERRLKELRISTPVVVDDELPMVVTSEFKQALEAGAPVENLVDIAVSLVKLSIVEKADSVIVSKGILSEAIEARESPQVVGQIAANIFDIAVTMGESSILVVKSIVSQIVESSLDVRKIAEILAEIVLEVEEKNQPEIIKSIINEEMLSDEQLVEIHCYLLERDEQAADNFWTKAQQIRIQGSKTPDESIKEMSQSDVKSGLLSRLKAKLQGMKQVEVEENYSELNHRYAVMMARSNIEKRFL